MKVRNISKFFISHIAAGFVSFLIFVLMSIMSVVAIMIVDNDPGGPMFFPMFLAFCVIGALLLCFACFVTSALFQWLKRLINYPKWLPVVIIFFIVSAGILLFRPRGFGVPVLTFYSFVISTGFLIYWLLLLVFDKILNRIWK
jgi:hypothetical protein